MADLALRALTLLDELERLGAKVDVIYPDGYHRYWSTHCRHGNHELCKGSMNTRDKIVKADGFGDASAVPAYKLEAAKAVLADRERELLELKGPCSNGRCRLHYAHSGPCDERKEPTIP